MNFYIIIVWGGACVCMCMRYAFVCMCVCVLACVRTYVRACVRACVFACVWLRVGDIVCVHADWHLNTKWILCDHVPVDDVYLSHIFSSVPHDRRFVCDESTSPVATPICSIVNLVAVRSDSVLFFDMEVIIWVYRCFFSLVARAATFGNSWNLHKSKMAAMDSDASEFASGWDIIQLIYLQSCVTLLYQIMFTRGIDFWGQFGD